MSVSIPPVQIYGLVDFNGNGVFTRTYTVSYAPFVEIQGGATIISANAVGGSGISAVLGSPGTTSVPITISGGSLTGGEDTQGNPGGPNYTGSIQVVLSNNAKVEQPYLYTLVTAGNGPAQSNFLNFITLPKTPYYDRFYQFPFGKYFPDWSTGNPITGTPTVVADSTAGGLVLGIPTVFTGGLVVCEIRGGSLTGGLNSDGVYNLIARCDLQDGTQLAMAGQLQLLTNMPL